MGSSPPALGASHPLCRDLPGFARELGVFERYFYLKNKDDHSFYLCNALHIISKVPLTENLIQKALQRLMKMIPTLRYVIREHLPDGTPLDSPVFIESSNPAIDLETLETTEWIDVISQEWSKFFDTYKGPCWRVKFLPNVEQKECDDKFRYGGTVVFSFLHSIIDGMSYQRTFGHFLDCLEAVTLGSKEEPTSFKLCPPLDHYLEVKPGIFDPLIRVFLTPMIRYQMGRRLFGWVNILGKKHNYLSSAKLPIEVDPSTPEITSLIPFVISREDVACIVRATKAMGTTLNGTLTAAATFAYAKMIQGNYPINMGFQTECPVSMRRFFKEVTLDSFGMYVQMILYKVHVSLKKANDEYDAFWALAKSVTSEIKQKIDDKSYLEFFTFVRHVIPLLEKYHPPNSDLTPYKYGRDEAEFYVTNMMKNDFLTRGDDANFKLVGRFGGITTSKGGPIIGNNLNTFNDQIYWTILYDTHIICRDRVVAYEKVLQETLKNMCGDSAV